MAPRAAHLPLARLGLSLELEGQEVELRVVRVHRSRQGLMEGRDLRRLGAVSWEELGMPSLGGKRKAQEAGAAEE